MPSADWHDLSLSSWGLVEDSLVERFDSALAAAQRTKRGVSLVGRKSQAVALCKVLEEVSALYSWDTPALQSPVKMGRKAEQKRRTILQRQRQLKILEPWSGKVQAKSGFPG